jgi:hypothetical protein
MTQNLDTADFIVDKACLVHDDLDSKPEPVPDGWKIRTMFRDISWDHWKRRHTVHVDEISAIPEQSTRISQMLDGRVLKYALRNMKTIGFPFFVVFGDYVVYFVSKAESDDDVFWIVGVDLEGKQLEIIEPYSAASASSFDSTVLPLCILQIYECHSKACFSSLVV